MKKRSFKMVSAFFGIAAGFWLALSFYVPGWATLSQSRPSIVPTRTPTPLARVQALARQSLPPIESSGSIARFDRVPLGDVGKAKAPRNSEQLPSSAGAPNCRYGVAAWGPAQMNWLPSLGVGWYLDFGAHVPSEPSEIEMAQVIHIKQNKSGCTYLSGYSVSPLLTDPDLGALIAANPGALWLVGNEPDRGPDPGECSPGQDDTFPEIYAQAYHDVYEFIKQRDPTAQVAVAGLVEVTPGRLQYLDKVWQAYLQQFQQTMPVDVWNMHLYILPEALPNGQPNGIANVALGTDLTRAIQESGGNTAICSNATDNVYCWAEHDSLAVFARQITAMRTWMQQHGQQNKPLILSEYSQLYPFEDYDDPVNPTTCYLRDEYGQCFTSPRVTHFMTQTFTYLETAVNSNLGFPPDDYRLVQQWMWFSMQHMGAGYVSNLLDDTLTSLTPVGQVFFQTVNGVPTYVNLLPDNLAHPIAFTAAPSDTVTATLSVDIRNNGNTFAAGPITVTFYSDASLTQIIGSAGITQSLGGCARSSVCVTTTWAGLTSGSHDYWVNIEGDTPRTSDNVASGYVLVDPNQVFLPLILR